MNKSTKLPLLISAALISSPICLPAFAQAQKVVPGVGLITTFQPGQFDFNNFDKTQIQALVTQEYFKRNKTDLDFLLQTRNAIQTDFEAFTQKHVYGALADAQKDYFTGGSTKIEQFYDVVTAYNAQKMALNTKIDSLVTLSTTIQSSPELQTQGSGAGQVPHPP